ncbi:XdhC/CoxI family protein [Lichenihabitans sp. PAMC28606]|uniref:XdhC family protein n=1 Tax=Lichenihabitans sp. PAMC28606 TaxID=2880932 RepID=UPI001D0AFDA2|nr:XdhC/CoxI family protein [Lichenihabitans sp. PAMC28606]UDL94023.1 XdhC/CoxI family protein [Lichenihabitans sp. PAMC28606]
MAEDILDLVSAMKARGATFALATVVRTVSVTAAKAGAKAVIEADGSISGGWIGGGCARGAVIRAARAALQDGTPRLVSIQPKDLLDHQHIGAGEVRDGIEFSRNMCPSQGTMDIFIEPILPRPSLVIVGSSPVGVALANLARQIGYATTVCAPAAEHAAFSAADYWNDGFALPDAADGARFVVICTQGKGDAAALAAAVQAPPSAYLAFVGSRRKADALRIELAEKHGLPADRLAAFKAPAGLDLGAITPDEIALSILAEITITRRRGQRDA